MIYLDSSALLKLLFEERESVALAEWLFVRSSVPAVSSELARIEVVRATRRLHPSGIAAARALVAQLDLIPMSSTLLAAAADADDPWLRSLDAIHLCSAMSIAEHLTSFVAYDRRLSTAAAAAGLPITVPGAESANRP